ncbi:hypothetical protein [Sphingopyxis panaciterrae]
MAALDDAVEQAYRDAGLNFRPRFYPYFRLLMARDSASVGECVAALGFTQPAATQTLQTMIREGLIESVPARDRRERRFILTAAARAMIPDLEAIWAATTDAARALDAALPHPLGATVDAALEQLERQSFGDLIQKDRSP